MNSELVGSYDWVKGGSMEKYTQDLTLNANGTASYKEFNETRSERWERTGHGKWKVENDVVWVILDELKKETKALKPQIPAIPGFHEDVKIDKNIAIDIPVDKLKSAPASGPSAPKNRWRRV